MLSDIKFGGGRISESLRLIDQVWPADVAPLVSVFCWTYNDAKFIRQSIDSILFQETTFPVEIILHDDASDDGTLGIIRDYETKYPHLFRNIIHTDNQWSQGKSLMTSLSTAPRGAFVALTHGDDYWTSPSKLQRQIDLLERHPSALLCFHDHVEVDEAGRVLGTFFCSAPQELLPLGAHIRRECHHIRTASMILRSRLLEAVPTWFQQLPFGDTSLQALASLQGPLAYLPGICSAYRVHDRGIFSRGRKDPDLHGYLDHIIFWDGITASFFSRLADETAASQMRSLCWRRAFEDYLHAAWSCRLAGRCQRGLERLWDAARCAPSAAVTSRPFWLLLFVLCFPWLDFLRRRALQEVSREREAECSRETSGLTSLDLDQ
jgi:glycosyltransferase involved in cell wall biosynthesis